jgi:hypothetical protein
MRDPIKSIVRPTLSMLRISDRPRSKEEIEAYLPHIIEALT